MKYPPLKVWIVTLLIFGVIFLTTVILIPIKSAYIFKKSIEYAFVNNEANSNSIRVIFLGSSLLRDALSDKEIIRTIQQEKSQIFDIVKIGVGGAVLKDFFANEYFIQNAIEYKPDFIFIQESILLRKESSPNIKSLLSREELVGIWNGTYSLFKEEHMKNVLREEVYADSVVTSKAFQFCLIDFEINHRILVEFIKRIDGPSIVIAEVPLPWEIEKKRNVILESTDYSLFKSSLEENDKVRFLSFDQRLHYKYFADRTHMNDTGESIYTDWFLDQMIHLVHTDSSTHD